MFFHTQKNINPTIKQLLYSPAPEFFLITAQLLMRFI